MVDDANFKRKARHEFARSPGLKCKHFAGVLFEVKSIDFKRYLPYALEERWS